MSESTAKWYESFSSPSRQREKWEHQRFNEDEDFGFSPVASSPAASPAVVSVPALELPSPSKIAANAPKSQAPIASPDAELGCASDAERNREHTGSSAASGSDPVPAG